MIMDSTLVSPALHEIRRILRAAEEGERKLAQATGLTPSQVLVLQEVNDGADVTPSEVAGALQLSQASITNIADRLEELGLLARRKGERDKRQVRLTLTNNGKQMLGEAPDLLQNRLSAGFAALASWEQAMMLTALGRVADLLDPAIGAAAVPAAKAGSDGFGRSSFGEDGAAFRPR
jgi:DNA-binding MarR family transcriptional regulator